MVKKMVILPSIICDEESEDSDYCDFLLEENDNLNNPLCVTT